MQIREEKVIKYVTEDGEVFLNKGDAIEYENELLRRRIYKTVIEAGPYKAYTINNQSELDALINEPYGERTFHLKEDLEFPLILCEESDSDEYYFQYRLLDDVIHLEIMLLDKLKSIKYKW